MKLKACLIVFLLLTLADRAFAEGYSYAYQDTENGLWGFSSDGVNFVEVQYQDVAPLSFDQPYFWAKKDNLWGLCNADNTVIIDFRYQDVCVNPFSYPSDSIMAVAFEKSTFDGITKPLKRMDMDYKHFPVQGHQSIPLYPVKKDGKWGYVNIKGEIIIPFQYKKAFIFEQYLPKDENKGRWLAGVQNEWGYYDVIDIMGEKVNDLLPEFTMTQKGFFRAEPDEEYLKRNLKKLSKKQKSKYDERLNALTLAYISIPQAAANEDKESKVAEAYNRLLMSPYPRSGDNLKDALENFINVCYSTPGYEYAAFTYDRLIDAYIEAYDQTYNPVFEEEDAIAGIEEPQKEKKSFWDRVNSVLDVMDNALNKLADVVSSSETINILADVLDAASQALPQESETATEEAGYQQPYEYDSYGDNDTDTSAKHKAKKQAETKKSISGQIYNAYQRNLNSIANQLNDFKIKKSNEGLSDSDFREIKRLKKKARDIRKECRDKYGEELPSNSIENWNP